MGLFKQLVVLGLLSLIAGEVKAEVYIGPRLGTNIFFPTNVSATNSEANAGATPGWAIGINLDVPLSRDFYIDSELSYSQRRFAAKLGGSLPVGGQLDVLKLVTVLKWRPGNGWFHPVVMAGPGIGIPVTQVLTVGNAATAPEVTALDFMIVGGLGMEADIGDGVSVSLHGRMSTGISTFMGAFGNTMNSGGLEVLTGIRWRLGQPIKNAKRIVNEKRSRRKALKVKSASIE